MNKSQPPNENPFAVQVHLTIMQDVIKRMAKNSRFCKFSCVILVAATFLLATLTGESTYALIALVPTLLFAFSDSYYLALERSFIKSQNAFVMKLHSGELESRNFFRIFPSGMGLPSVMRSLLGSMSIWPFYLLVAATILLTWLLI